MGMSPCAIDVFCSQRSALHSSQVDLNVIVQCGIVI